jgi:hypothetical protein
MSRARRRTAAALPFAASLLAVAVLTSAPGSAAPAAAPKPNVSLRIAANDGSGRASPARLTCRGDVATSTGYLRYRPVTACRHARKIAAFLAARPITTRPCTQEYGGPQTARVRGSIGSRSIDRRFARRNGCEIADWARAGTLVPRLK